MPHDLDETFAVQERIMVRDVRPRRGTPYRHTCDLEVFEAVAHAIDDLDGGSFTVETLREATGLPFTQINVTLAFLRERGIVVETLRRKSMAASESIHLDAMTEWHALREKGPPPESPHAP